MGVMEAVVMMALAETVVVLLVMGVEVELCGDA